MTGDRHVRFCESGRGRIPPATHHYGDEFRGAVAGLGSLGIVVRLSLDVVPTYDLRQHVYEDLAREEVDEHLTDIFSAAYSVSLFTDWRSQRVRQAWRKERVTEANPRRQSPDGLADGLRTARAIRFPGCLPRTRPSSWASLVRGTSGCRTSGLTTWTNDPTAVVPAIIAVERVLAPFEPRPHWGKLHGISPQVVRERYDRLPDFRQLVRHYDPAGKFRNDVTDKYLEAGGQATGRTMTHPGAVR